MENKLENQMETELSSILLGIKMYQDVMGVWITPMAKKTIGPNDGHRTQTEFMFAIEIPFYAAPKTQAEQDATLLAAWASTCWLSCTVYLVPKWDTFFKLQLYIPYWSLRD